MTHEINNVFNQTWCDVAELKLGWLIQVSPLDRYFSTLISFRKFADKSENLEVSQIMYKIDID